VYIVMVSPECAPVAHAGGLGDVVFGLSRELEIRGNAVDVILPKYDCLRYDQIRGLTLSYRDLWVPWYNGTIHCSVWFGFVHGRKCFFIEPHSQDNFFARGAIYGSADDTMRFAFFCKAALEFRLKANKRPEVIHCHGWTTGLVPVLLFEIYKFHGMPHQRVCYTIHNFGHQGIDGERVLWATGLGRPEHYSHCDRLRDDLNPVALNFMKGGIGRFHVEGGSWTNNISWVRGYDALLGPMERVSSLFYEKVLKPGLPSSEHRYRNALFHLLVSQTSCYRYWGQGMWLDYGREICRRAAEILSHDF